LSGTVAGLFSLLGARQCPVQRAGSGNGMSHQ
jgi:hypothetical protein